MKALSIHPNMRDANRKAVSSKRKLSLASEVGYHTTYSKLQTESNRGVW